MSTHPTDEPALETVAATVDRQAQSIYVYLDDAAMVTATRELSDTVNGDYDKVGNLVGVEVLGINIPAEQAVRTIVAASPVPQGTPPDAEQGTEDTDYRTAVAEAIAGCQVADQARGYVDVGVMVNAVMTVLGPIAEAANLFDATCAASALGIRVASNEDMLAEATRLRAELAEYDGASFDNQRLTGDLIVHQGITRELRAELATTRDALTNARAKNGDNIADREKMLRDIMAERDQARAELAEAQRERDEARMERDLLSDATPCRDCDGTGIKPADYYGPDEDGAPYCDEDRPCPQGCSLRSDIRYLLGREKEAEDFEKENTALRESRFRWAEEAAASVRLPEDWREDIMSIPSLVDGHLVVDDLVRMIEGWRGGTGEEER